MLEYYALPIIEIKNTARDAVCVTFDVPSELTKKFKYQPGQHISIRRKIDGKDVRRFYSICSSHKDEKLRIAIRHVDGGKLSSFLNSKAKIGDAIEVLAPRGRFCPPAKTSSGHILGFAAGSGITPVYSIIKSHLENNNQATAILVYGNRHIETMMLRDEINALKDTYLQRFQILHVLSQEQRDIEMHNGRIDSDLINTLIRNQQLDSRLTEQVYICGPDTMIETTRSALIKHGWKAEDILSEIFTGNTNRKTTASKRSHSATVSGVEVSYTLDGRAQKFTIDAPDDTILNGAQKVGLELPFSCAGGMCATCRCKLVEGKVEMAENYSLEPWEIEAGFILACQSHPLTPKLQLDFDAS